MPARYRIPPGPSVESLRAELRAHHERMPATLQALRAADGAGPGHKSSTRLVRIIRRISKRT